MKFSMMKVFLVSAAVLGVVAYGALPAVADELDNLLEKPRIYVGSGKCKSCHLAQYYSWRTTMHSRKGEPGTPHQRTPGQIPGTNSV